ncbi:MAG: hypothetical protein KGI38_04265 [Thaumarchaeota archaeon]|nr:hypothetical protein [Nitrososphaerota archaeon]
MAKRATVLRWTGEGDFARLEASVERILGARRIQAAVRRMGDSLAVTGPEPALVSALFQHMPGVAWSAAGIYATGLKGVTKASATLASKYLRRRDRFSVDAEVSTGVPSDLAGAVTAAILESVKGSRVSSYAPKVRFRAALDGSKGVVGVEIFQGPGGIPTGSVSAICFVSGGTHSSVVAWKAVLMGLRAKLVHVKSDEESLLAVANLYSELSHRSDPRGLALEVLDGASVPVALKRYAAGHAAISFGGFTAAGGNIPDMLKGLVAAPLYLMPEETFEAEFSSLGLKGYDMKTEWDGDGSEKYSARSFGGLTADVSEVLDGLE